MIVVKSQLKKKEESEIKGILAELSDIYGDFYITKNNLRLFIRENVEILFKNLKKGDIIAFSENEGLALVVGFSDNAPRKYIKILAKNDSSAEKLIKVILKNINCDIYAKIKKNNPIKKILENIGFDFVAPRGKEVLLKRRYK